ncbi:hypothetical protein V3C99_013453 [Haemonchus contortus]|uniref:Protein pygopus-like n=1 Tax=Haemonchus contortus TaxID=6289 RepID=A0A7I5E6U6_HAECO|nr:unnamed protein product [Haemonchus contortus]
MQALSFTFLLFISLSTVETRRGSSQKEDEKEIVSLWPGGTTSDNEDKGSIKDLNNGHEILPMHPNTDNEGVKERNGNEIRAMNPNPRGTTPGYTDDGSTLGRIMNENYPTWPTVNTPSYIEKGSTRRKGEDKTRSTLPTITTPRYDESGFTQGNAPPPTKPPARTHGNKEKDCLEGNNGWPGYGGRGCGEGNNTNDKPSSKPSSPPLGRPRYRGRGRGYGRGKNRPLGEIIVSISGWPGYGGRVFDKGNNAGYKPPKKPSVSYLEWPGYGGKGLTQGSTRLGSGGLQGIQINLGRSPSVQPLFSAIKQ